MISNNLCKSFNIMTIGYYADIANECQVFHICQPVTYADGETETFKWSMICPEQTVFDQVMFILNIHIPTYNMIILKRYFIIQFNVLYSFYRVHWCVHFLWMLYHVRNRKLLWMGLLQSTLGSV